MQRHNHIHAAYRPGILRRTRAVRSWRRGSLLVPQGILRNIPLQEQQLLISVLFTQLITPPDHLFLKIQPDDPDIILLQLMQIIIHGKCQVRFAASEIQDRKLPVSVQFR